MLDYLFIGVSVSSCKLTLHTMSRSWLMPDQDLPAATLVSRNFELPGVARRPVH